MNLWCNPVWKAEKGEKAELGYWGMELAKRLVASEKIPICIINGAVGGTRIDQHQRSESNPTDLSTIYGRMLWRVQQARLTHGIRGVIWHQGENDQGADGPTGGYGWESYQQYFLDMSAAWKQDFPNIQHYYLFQIWPNSCSMGNGHGDMLREVQRTLAASFLEHGRHVDARHQADRALPLSLDRLGGICPPDPTPHRARQLRQGAGRIHHRAEPPAGVLL